MPGAASTAPGGRAGDDALVTATLRADADDEAAAEAAVGAFARADGVTVGGGAVAGLQIGETVGEDLGRAELLAFPQDFLKSMGIAGAIVAVVAGLASLVISPALFALRGAKLARRGGADATEGRGWHRLAHAVMRRAKLVAPLTALAMLALSLPALTTTWSAIEATAIPEGMSARTVADAVNRADGAAKAPVVVAVSAPAGERAEVEAFAGRISGVAGVERVAPPRDLGSGTWQLDAIASGDPSGPVAQDAVGAIRAIGVPFDVKVGGGAAEFVDQQAAIGCRLLPAVVLLVGLTLLVLWLMTGSVVLPVKAVVMNALTVGTALTPLVLIYQGGHLTGLLGYTPNGG